MKKARWERWRVVVTAKLFAVAMGVLEAVTVVYIRKMAGLEGAMDALDPKVREALLVRFARMRMAGEAGHLSPEFLLVERIREAATIVMLLAVAMLAGRTWKERTGFFLFCFGVWDIVYYGVLWLLVRWPPSPETLDVLFLIPFPWVAQVWIPIAISACFVAWGTWAIWFDRASRKSR